MAIGLPSINISFKELATTVKERSARGIIAMVLKDTKALGFNEIHEKEDIPADLSAENKDYINMALMGNVNAPNKVLVYVLGGEEEVQSALDFLETKEFNYLCMPKAIEADKNVIKSWIIKLRDTDKVKVKAILGKVAGNHEGIINFTTEDTLVGTKKYSAEEFTSRIAGIIAGTPLSQSITYTKLGDVIDIPKSTKADAESKVNNGELILIKEAGAIRIARGINSLTDLTEEKGEMFQKIKIVDTLDIINNDIKKVIIDDYIGKIPNSYDNKCILIVAIKEYLEELEKEELIEAGSIIDIDIESQKQYLKSKNIDISNMKEQELREANTGSKVFLTSKIKMLDAMEDIDLSIEI
ncbi:MULTISPECIES: phage tail sheath subtilisin-like domain-containing protein [unclassified Clostridioides]|uniref:phage tail sheath subtilisin-like domain-containing protein n=1 Tax=unclassified Clostridioides TaxID=2635829 RepID=UPI001D0C20BB|nr:phage tail sheath subtilisin-like domain-containing protein [Clostridioides sp. ES-S-0048-02]MCC0703423.1 phage tail sheath subtilisin-like domain-containing protein [Clostridioides sp. ES-S-0049-02]MCC0763225.1 phage tail sheath subtilisin-like domain-containing protein [Clostridioides sp. ES-S-0006-03]